MDMAGWVLVLVLSHPRGIGLATAPVLYPSEEQCAAAGRAFDRWRRADWHCIPGPVEETKEGRR